MFALSLATLRDVRSSHSMALGACDRQRRGASALPSPEVGARNLSMSRRRVDERAPPRFVAATTCMHRGNPLESYTCMSKSPAVSQYPCPNCGANTVFGPGTMALVCDHCSTKTPIEVAAKPIDENTFDATAVAHATPTLAPKDGTFELQCKTCGARTQSAAHATRCPFCDSAVVVELPPEPAVAPQAVLPFAVTHEASQKAFVEWLRSRWFAPNALATRAKRDGLVGVYLPYWTYDAQTQTSYQGERGDNYWETETYTDANGNTQTRSVQRTRWSYASGSVDVSFDDVLVLGSASLPAELVNRLEPWDLPELAPFDGRFLAGFTSERQQVSLGDGFTTAKSRMEPKIHRAICADIGGDHQRVSSKNTHYDDVTWKHILMPMWISAFRLNDRVFRVVVNARTGEVSGERPYSAVKIALFVLMIIAVIVGLVYLARKP